MFIPHYIGIVLSAEQQLLESFQVVADRHYKEFEIRSMCKQFAGWCDGRIKVLQPLSERYHAEKSDAPLRLRSSLFHGSRAGSLGLLHDLQDLGILLNALTTNYTILIQAGMSVKDKELTETGKKFREETNRTSEWICSHIKSVSPQAVTVPPDLDLEAAASVRAEPRLPTPGAGH